MTGIKEKGPKDITGAGQAAPEGVSDANAAQLNRGMPITIMGQYVRDISFENPNAPETLYAKNAKPILDINFSMGVQKIQNQNKLDMFEVNLGVTATARFENTVCYIAEIEYAVLVALNGVAEERQHPTLLIKIPEFAFPFVRQILANLTQQGGYMPLLLAPVDFRAMYIDRFGEKGVPAQKEAAVG
ncbi:MAG: protein-export chaperone SecB [Alphaproteobacteria bacterium]|nr:protein-export chaperone SecB [Alphaproteobacteria bacterium]MBU0858875.1 protein-export chaperone SecB [Alphaproteobacteria bacterium]